MFFIIIGQISDGMSSTQFYNFKIIVLNDVYGGLIINYDGVVAGVEEIFAEIG